MSRAVCVDAEDVRRSPFRVSVTPLPSLNRALRGAIGGGSDGTPQRWCDAIRAHLRSTDYETLVPFLDSCPMPMPRPLLGLAPAPGESFKDGVEHMMGTPIELLAEEIARCGTLLGNGAWDDAARDPGLWLRRYVASLLRAWKGFGPVWRQARAALDREVERIGTATALDAQLELLDGLLPTGVVKDGRWCVKDNLSGGRVRFPDSGVVLMPLVAGKASKGLVRAGDILEYVSYPLRRVLALRPEPPAPAFEGLLGLQRAKILRALRCPDQHRHPRGGVARRAQRRHAPRRCAGSSRPRRALPPRTPRAG
jgi:hypothetical protein